MAIYLRGGMPIEITAAERRKFWTVRTPGNLYTYFQPPTPQQLRRADEVRLNWTWFAKAKCLGPYPDGSGSDEIGGDVDSMAEADGFIHTNDMVADDGIREIYDACKVFQPMTPEQFSEWLAPEQELTMKLQPA